LADQHQSQQSQTEKTTTIVPQQAELALRLLLELPERKENDNE